MQELIQIYIDQQHHIFTFITSDTEKWLYILQIICNVLQ